MEMFLMFLFGFALCFVLIVIYKKFFDNSNEISTIYEHLYLLEKGINENTKIIINIDKSIKNLIMSNRNFVDLKQSIDLVIGKINYQKENYDKLVLAYHNIAKYLKSVTHDIRQLQIILADNHNNNDEKIKIIIDVINQNYDDYQNTFAKITQDINKLPKYEIVENVDKNITTILNGQKYFMEICQAISSSHQDINASITLLHQHLSSSEQWI